MVGPILLHSLGFLLAAVFLRLASSLASRAHVCLSSHCRSAKIRNESPLALRVFGESVISSSHLVELCPYLAP